MSYKEKVFLSKQFRKNPTPSEKIMWDYLKNRRFMNLKFRRQYTVLGYILDFYCFELRLAIEIDGPIHEHQKSHDYLREELIKKKNIKFIRFKNSDVENNITLVLDNLQNFILKLKNNE